MNLLKSVPNSCLWILQNNPRAVGNLTQFAVLSGVAAERLVFADMLPRAEHLARMACADLGSTRISTTVTRQPATHYGQVFPSSRCKVGISRRVSRPVC